MTGRTSASPDTAWTDNGLEWVWLFGPCGTGKTATGFELYRQLAAEGRRIGFVEVDQLGMCLPDDDPIRAPIKTANLLTAIHNFRAAGAEGLVVSGDIAGPPMDEVIRGCGTHPPVLVRLRAAHATCETRLRARGAPQAYVDWSKSYDMRFTRIGTLELTTDYLTVVQAATRIRSMLGAWPSSVPRAARPAASHPSVKSSGEAVLISGPTPDGKSTVAWLLFMRSLTDGIRTAYLDLAQIGFLRADDGSDVELKARNLTDMWSNFAAHGARRIILSGDVRSEAELARYRTALPGVGLGAFELTADMPTLLERALLRGQGHATELPGDHLRGATAVYLEQLARTSHGRVTSSPFRGVRRVPTDDRTPDQVAAELARETLGTTPHG